MAKKIIKLTENDIKNMIQEAVQNVLTEGDEPIGSGEAVVGKILNELIDFMSSQHVVFTTPNPSTTEQIVAKCLNQARNSLAQAKLALRSLRY